MHETGLPSSLPPYCPVAPSRRRRRAEIETPPIAAQTRGRRNDRGERMLTVAPLSGTKGAVLPMIRIRGAWLRKLGFSIGARIVVSEERGRLVLTIEQSERSAR